MMNQSELEIRCRQKIKFWYSRCAYLSEQVEALQSELERTNKIAEDLRYQVATLNFDIIACQKEFDNKEE